MILVVDDDRDLGKVLCALLRQDGLAAEQAGSGPEALRALESRPVDVVLSDFLMPEMDGLALLSEVRKRWPDVPVVMLSAHGNVPVAVEAMKRGAADFLLKPFDRDEVIRTVRKALAAADHSSRGAPKAAPAPGGILGRSAPVRALLALIARAAPVTTTILVEGETGTGKELVAGLLHDASPRRERPFVVVNCAALPEPLLESELFGYEKGAFTGANCRKPGRVELAEGGTLFLDEIGEVPLSMQPKLLRLLQERELVRVGGTRTVKVDVRFVAATHRDLEAMVAEGRFREDLLYRLNVLPIRVPALRERAEDIAELAVHFCDVIAAENGRSGVRLDPGALDGLAAHGWPGNVRELQNLIERLVILCDGPTIGRDDVERVLGGHRESRPSDAGSETTLEARRRDAETTALRHALERARGNKTIAARLLGVSRRTLYNKLAELGLG